MNAGNIVESILDPLVESLPPETAHRILGFRVDSETQARVDELAAKANDGTIDDQERREYHELVEAFDLVGILKARAQHALSQSS